MSCKSTSERSLYRRVRRIDGIAFRQDFVKDVRSSTFQDFVPFEDLLCTDTWQRAPAHRPSDSGQSLTGNYDIATRACGAPTMPTTQSSKRERTPWNPQSPPIGRPP